MEFGDEPPMDRRCHVCLHHIQRPRVPCPECGTQFPLHGYPRDGLLGRPRPPLAMSPVRRQFALLVEAVPQWLGVPLALVAGAIIAVVLFAGIMRLLG